MKYTHKLSVAIPAYEMRGLGPKFMKRSLDMLEKQTFDDFEVVVSDNSENEEIRNLLEYYTLDIRYVKNPIKGISPNTNSAIRNSKGELIKILYEDDYLASEESLQKIVDNFSTQDKWMATGCLHYQDGSLINPHYPAYNRDIYVGNNTIGSPSVVTIRNGIGIELDDTLTWLLDCDYYARMYKKYGEPKMIYDLNVVIGLGKHQVTNALSDAIKRQEVEYMMKKII